MNEKKLKLNLGSGDKLLDEYENLDIKRGDSAYPLGYDDGTLDEIRASHILEHYAHRLVQKVLRHWVDKVKPGGVLKIAVPNAQEIFQRAGDGKSLDVQGFIMGGQTDEHDYHKSLFTPATLKQLMEGVGLVGIERWWSEIDDCASLAISLNLKGSKPVADSSVSVAHTGEVPTILPRGEPVVPRWRTQPEVTERSLDNYKPMKVAAVMSMPRLAFTDNMFSVVRALAPLGIQVEQGQGVFWSQVLTRAMEKRIDDGTEFILAIDYDTYFLQAHVLRLCELMLANPEVDAIVPMQVSRNGDFCLFACADGEGEL
ncbi:hypothetical protein LCGC14_2631180, partial [marine sediment metagenome]